MLSVSAPRALVGWTLLAWGLAEIMLRLRLMVRPGLRARLRQWPTIARARARDWTFAVIVILLAAAVLFAAWAARFRWAATGGGWPVVAVGETVLAVGVALRLSAILTLDRFFTFVVGIADDHQVIRDGPYRVVRHPGYAGALLALLGFGIALENWLSAVVMLVVPPLVLAVRIRFEESALVGALGEEYRSYARRTAGLIPGIW